MIKRVVLILTVVVMLVAMVVSCAPREEQVPKEIAEAPTASMPPNEEMQTDEVPAVPVDMEVETSGLGVRWTIYQKVDGWIFYVDFSTAKLWRVNAQGDEKKQIGEDSISNFVTNGDRVFYIGGDGQDLYSVNIDGRDKSFVHRFEDKFSGLKKMQIVDDWIYILPTLYHYIYKVKIDGSQGSYLDTEGLGMTDFSVEGDQIYYLNLTFGENGNGVQLWQMSTDGTKQQQMMKEVAMPDAIDFDDNWIYYLDIEDKDMYKVSFDGNEKHKITEGDGGVFLKVINGWVYFDNSGENKGLYKARIDGSERTRIATIDHLSMEYFIWGNWLMRFEADKMSVIRVSDSEETDAIIKRTLSDLSAVKLNVQIYE